MFSRMGGLSGATDSLGSSPAYAVTENVMARVAVPQIKRISVRDRRRDNMDTANSLALWHRILSQILVPAVRLDQLHNLAHSLFVVLIDHQRGVGGVDDNDVFHTDCSDEVIFG